MIVSSFKDNNSMGHVISVMVTDDEKAELSNIILQRVVEKVADVITGDILEKNYNEIMSKISPEAIANMAIAEAGAKINETLNKKLPDKIVEIEKRSTTIYQRGLFGGLKRL